ncbi:MAG: hypothetical protein WCC27_03610 [Acidobacteriaceae bacterium]
MASNPQPPTLWLPAPVKDLTATRVGDEVHLHWTMPKETTDKVTLKGDQRAHFCWESEASPAAKPAASGKAGAGKAAKQAPKMGPDPCQALADGMFPPEKAADFTVKMPADFVAGVPRAVAFFVELQNHAGKTAGPSNAAWVATGVAPAGVTGLRLETRAAGVVLHWDEAGPQARMVLRIHRTLVPRPAAEKPNAANGSPPPEQQVLEVDLDKADPGVALDHDAALDHAWKYWAERVLKVEIDQHALEIAGPPSPTVTIDAKDVFPPSVPAEVAAVADAQARAIDLSWTPDTDTDLAGYVVYRRDVTAGTAMERLSGKALVVPPSFGDTAVVAGHRYAYAVSAVDQDGNESARSGEVEEELPNE